MATTEETQTQSMTEERFSALLLEALLEQEVEMELGSVSTFSEAGVMTRNEGLVVRLSSGEEFQVTVVRSR